MGIKRVVKETTVTVEEKPLVLVALYLVQYPCKLGLSQRNQKYIRLYCKLQVVFKYKKRLGKTLLFKYRIPKDPTSGVIHKVRCGHYNEFYYNEYVDTINR